MDQLDILLVEDNLGDYCLTREALKEGSLNNRLHWAKDGVEALAFLHRSPPFTDAPRPDLILLDLNLPRMDGRELLHIIKQDPELMHIPVVVLTTSTAEDDVLNSYEVHANCYITKPVDLESFFKVIKSIEGFWLNVARLPVTPTQ